MKLVDLKKVMRMDELIQKERTGTPAEFAKKLDFSRTKFFAYMAYLREELCADIKYDSYRETYYYEEENALSVFSKQHCDLCRKKLIAECITNKQA